MRVLVVEGSLEPASFMRRALRKNGVVADVARTGEDALWMAGSAHYHVILLNGALPDIDGVQACRRLRERGVLTPILMMIGRGAAAARVGCLDAGADGCVTKPFHLAELLARLRALARRAPRERPPVLIVGDLRFDLATCEVRRGEREIRLTPRERDLLEVLMRHPGRAISRYELLDGAWDGAAECRPKVVDVYVRYLRTKIGRDSIETVPGIGYRLREAA